MDMTFLRSYWKIGLTLFLVVSMWIHVASLDEKAHANTERMTQLESTMKQATTQMNDMVRMLRDQIELLARHQAAVINHAKAKTKN